MAAAVGVTAAATSRGSQDLPPSPTAAAETAHPVGTGASPGPTGGSGASVASTRGSLASFAAALGVRESDLRSALAGARADVRARQPQPSGAAAVQAAVVAALAARLGKPEAQVGPAFQAFIDAHRPDSRETLVRRLDAAVAAGRLTQAERAAILNAYDSGLLNRGGGAADHLGSGTASGAARP